MVKLALFGCVCGASEQAPSVARRPGEQHPPSHPTCPMQLRKPALKGRKRLGGRAAST